MAQDERRRPTTADYALIFEDHQIGAAILEQLIVFSLRKTNSSGIDRVLDTERQAGRREVLDFIVAQINRNNGINDDETTVG